MSKFKSFIYICICAICCLSFSAQARVCFLGSDDAACTTNGFTGFTGCPGYSQCAYPKQGAVSAEATCGENYADWYKSSDCCSSYSQYTVCASPKECISTADQCQARVSKKYSELTDEERVNCPKVQRPASEAGQLAWANRKCPVSYTLCAPQNCKCPSTYGVCPSGTVGVGTPCNDGGVDKYQSCACPSTYKDCAEYTNTAGVGTSCQDVDYSTGTASYSAKKYTQCDCVKLSSAYEGWKSTTTTCSKSCETCITYNGNVSGTQEETYYNCKSVSTPSCECAYTTDSEGCKVGCTDSNWAYVGDTLEHVKWLLKEKSPVSASVCGSIPCCEAGSWDKADYTTNTASFCKYLGYSGTAAAITTIDTGTTNYLYSCVVGQTALKCPFNLKYYACAGQPTKIVAATTCSTTDYPYTEELNNATCSSCTSDGTTRYACECKDGYTKLTSTVTGTTSCAQKISLGTLCTESLYPYTSALSNATCTSCTATDGTTRYSCECKSGYTMNTAKTKCLQDLISGDDLIINPGNSSSECPCTNAAKPYYYNGSCLATCPTDSTGLSCFMCNLSYEIES
jgi:hypothetical protein